MKQVLIMAGNPVQGLIKQAFDGEYRLTEAKTKEEMSQYMSEIRPDLVIMNLSGFGTEGLELLSRLKKEPRTKHIPVIALIGGNDSFTERDAIALGADDIIREPLSSDILDVRVSMLLELYEYRKGSLDELRYQDTISVSIAELVECRDITTGGHLKNTTAYFKILLEEVMKTDRYKDAISTEVARDLIRSAPLHDIGKIGINDDILRKSSSLDYDEFEYMKTHTTLGKETFEKIMKETGETRFLKLARDLAYCHHERWDGSGYPCGLKGEEIPLYARILTIADVYDALTSRRTYKEALPHQKALKIIIDGRGSIFDPDLVDIFIDVNKSFEQALAKKYSKDTVI